VPSQYAGGGGLSDEDGLDDTSVPPDEEEQVEETRRVRPLFRFGRKNSKNDQTPKGEEEVEDAGPPEIGEEGDGHQTPVRPVRVLKFIPFGKKDPEEEPDDETPPFTETEGIIEEEAEPTFAVEEEAEPTFAVEEAEPPFAVEEEAEPTFAVEEAEPTFAVEEAEPPFAVEEGEAPFVVEEEAEPTFAVEEGETPFVVVEEEAAFTEVDSVPPAPLDAIEETRREEPVHDSVSVQEEAETGEEFQFRQEETPATFETHTQQASETPPPAAPIDETKPHYHKYLKPDEEMLQRKQATGPATGFDRDMDADAGEIDFGIDLIDPNERKKKRKKPPRKVEEGPKKGVGGHDSDGEVVTTQSGVDIGVDFQKRRKRRL